MGYRSPDRRVGFSRFPGDPTLTFSQRRFLSHNDSNKTKVTVQMEQNCCSVMAQRKPVGHVTMATHLDIRQGWALTNQKACYSNPQLFAFFHQFKATKFHGESK